MKNTVAAFEFQPFSYKQKQLLTWWMPQSPYKDYDIIIADGSIRSGKTVSMITSFIKWTIAEHRNKDFILAGKSMGALKRNVLKPMFQILAALGIPYRYHRSEYTIEIGSNTFYCFGANNESSQDVLQGLTAAGAYADEAALIPESFINQMIGRCSVEGSKVWLNCNPEGPYHFIKTDLIDKAEEKLILRLQFSLDDNLSLSEKVKNRYKRMFSGVFYKRYILGLWVMAEGIIYDAFDHDLHIVDKLPDMMKTWVAVDYGTSNATTFILCGQGTDEKFYVINEYYHSGKESGKQKSPSMYSKDFQEWFTAQRLKGYRPEYIFVDPAAEAFIVQLWNDLDPITRKLLAQADNTVKSGIERVSSLMSQDMFRVHRACTNVVRELASYVWDEKASERGEDKPVKQNDHTLDPIRYTVNGTIKLWQKLLRGGIAA